MFFKRSTREPEEKKAGLFARLRTALGATKENLVAQVEAVLSAREEIDEALLEDLEGALLGADLGVRATTRIMNEIRVLRNQQAIRTAEEVRAAIKRQLHAMITIPDRSGTSSSVGGPQVWMVVGVNGTGKTTTVGKLAARLAQEGNRTLVCAADTFRAAAIEQLTIWVERSGADIIKGRSGADPSAVLHDALAAAVARGSDIVIVDTAGRLHTRSNLMQELDKMRRVAGRTIPGAPHEVLLVIDAATGQNGLMQAREFLKATGVTGLIITKLDGTAKGGVVFGIAQELKIPVRFIGIGEGIDDLVEFSAEDFVDSLFSETQTAD
ncbi:MAG: signal recognition particle-docking protein FtsY [Acidobacteria bacterium]|nr:signal recognition particle-docking protein FtsY [Acidobacteriota bacterium]